MAIRLLDGEEAQRFCATLNTDPEFALLARDMDLHLVIEVGGDKRLLELRDGGLKSVRRFVPAGHSADIHLKGSAEFWQCLLARVPPPRFQNLYAAVHAANCEVLGNLELYNAYFPAINRMIDVMRDFQNHGPAGEERHGAI